MKIKYSSNKEDFFIFYFSQVFLKKQNLGNKIYDFSEALKIEKEKIRSISISNEDKINLLLGNNLEKFKEYCFLYNFYKEIKTENIENIINTLKDYSNKFEENLTKIFNENSMPEEIQISFISSPINGATTELDAFTSKGIGNKIFITIDEDQINHNKNKLEYYVKVLLHEITHIFINKNNKFQEIIKNEHKKYENIKIEEFRLNIEELIVRSIIFPSKDFGFLYEVLGLKENIEAKINSLSKNKYRKFSFEVLEKLKINKDENKLETELPIFIKNIIETGMFEK